MKYFILAVLFLFSAAVCAAQNKGISDPDDDRQQFASLGDFKLESGKVIHNCSVGYRTYGHLDSAKNNGVLFPSWFGGTAKDIERYASPWKIIDTNRYFLIIVDALGDGVSTSPSNSVQQHGPHFPVFSIRDMVESQHLMLTKLLGIQHLHAIIGISMGGMQTFQWGISYPYFAGRLIPIVASPQPSSYDLMGYQIFRKIIEADSTFNHGNYKVNPIIAPATMLLEFSVTTPANKIRTMSRDSFAVWMRQVENARALDWNDTYYQVLAVIGHDIARPYHGYLREAAKHIKAKMLIITSRQDHMVNPAPAIEFSKMLPAKLLILDSDLGHEAPNFDDPVMQKSITDMLASSQ
jgi:homoserine O-acetyltransferase